MDCGSIDDALMDLYHSIIMQNSNNVHASNTSIPDVQPKNSNLMAMNPCQLFG